MNIEKTRACALITWNIHLTRRYMSVTTRRSHLKWQQCFSNETIAFQRLHEDTTELPHPHLGNRPGGHPHHRWQWNKAGETDESKSVSSPVRWRCPWVQNLAVFHRWLLYHICRLISSSRLSEGFLFCVNARAVKWSLHRSEVWEAWGSTISPCLMGVVLPLYVLSVPRTVNGYNQASQQWPTWWLFQEG